MNVFPCSYRDISRILDSGAQDFLKLTLQCLLANFEKKTIDFGLIKGWKVVARSVEFELVGEINSRHLIHRWKAQDSQDSENQQGLFYKALKITKIKKTEIITKGLKEKRDGYICYIIISLQFCLELLSVYLSLKKVKYL